MAAGLTIVAGLLGSVAQSPASAQLLTSIAAEAGQTTTLAVHGNWMVRCETATEKNGAPRRAKMIVMSTL